MKHLLFLICALVLSACSSHPVQTIPVAQIEAPKNKVLLVFAHPDDETIMGALLIYLKERNIPVHAIYATNGSGGKHLSKPGLTPDEMGKVRESELELATKCYGFEYKIVGLKDAPFRDAHGLPIRDADIFLKSKAWDVNVLRKAIETEVNAFKPDVLITMGFSKTTHAHHQSVRIITEKLLNEKNLTSIKYALAMELSEKNRLELDTTPFANVANQCAHAHQSQGAGHGAPFYGKEIVSLFYSSAPIPSDLFGLKVIRQ